MRMISRRRGNADRKTASTERDRVLGAAQLDQVAAAGGSKGGGVGSEIPTNATAAGRG